MNKLLLIISLLLFQNVLNAQKTTHTELPTTIKEVRLHFPAIVSFGVYKLLNEKDLIGAKLGSGLIFPAFMGGLSLEYRHYFNPMNAKEGIAKSSFLYSVKPYTMSSSILQEGAKNTFVFGISGGLGYEWKLKSGFFLRPSAELNIPFSKSGDSFEGVGSASVMQSLISTVAIGYKW